MDIKNFTMYNNIYRPKTAISKRNICNIKKNMLKEHLKKNTKNKNLLNCDNTLYPSIIKENNLDIIYLLIKNSKDIYKPDKLENKCKLLKNYFSKYNKKTNNISKIDAAFYKYNLLYGYNSNNLIKSYTQKMRPKSTILRKSFLDSNDNYDYNSLVNINKLETIKKSISKKEINNDFNFNIKCLDKRCSLNQEEIECIFKAKCDDLKISLKSNLTNKFYNYCYKKCVNREVCLSKCNLGINSSKILSNVIKFSSRISRLDLSKNNIGDNGLIILIKGLKLNNSILHIDISSNNITQKGGYIFFEYLLENNSIISANIGSKEGLHRNRITSEGCSKLEEVLNFNKHLENLDISGNSINNEGLLLIAKGINNDIINKNKKINSLLSNYSFNNSLLIINLSNNEISCQGIKYILSINNSNIHTLILSENPINNDGIKLLSKYLNKQVFNSLKILELNKCNFNYEGLKCILECLEGNKKIQKLCMNCNNFNIKKNDNLLLKEAFNSINLKELSLSNCKLGDNLSKSVANGLLNNNTIKYINLSENYITDIGFMLFIDIPIKNNTLSKIDISKNQISDISANLFVKNLIKNKTINELNFYDNLLKNETATSLVEVIRSNFNITSINLNYNGIYTKTLEEINKQLTLNIEKNRIQKVPNLKKEIKQSYISELDFKNIDNKINDCLNVYESIDNKLGDEIKRIEKFKIEESKKLVESIEIFDSLNINIKEEEAKISKIKDEILFAEIDNNNLESRFKEEINVLKNTIYDLELEYNTVLNSNKKKKKNY